MLRDYEERRKQEMINEMIKKRAREQEDINLQEQQKPFNYMNPSNSSNLPQVGFSN
jgi:hypothetical protein